MVPFSFVPVIRDCCVRPLYSYIVSGVKFPLDALFNALSASSTGTTLSATDKWTFVCLIFPTIRRVGAVVVSFVVEEEVTFSTAIVDAPEGLVA